MQYFATITGKPHGMRSILKFTPVNWMLFLRLSKAQTCKWAVFAHLEFIICTQRHCVCSLLQLKSVNCTVLTTFWSPTLVKWLSARRILELGLPSSPPSLSPSFPSSCRDCRDYFLLSCWFSILIPFSFDKFAGGRGSVACSRYVNSSGEVSSEQPTALVAACHEGMFAVASVEAS